MDWEKLIEKYKIPLGILLAGIILAGIGTLVYLSAKNSSPQVEILSAVDTQKTIWVDLEGAIEKPGVYELIDGSRLNDLLIKASGLSAEADRDWIAKNLNLAIKLSDGQKLFIPNKQESRIQNQELSISNKININTASVPRLDTLWGIGESRAQNIIAGRPYQAIEELISRKIIPQSVYDKIKEQISVN